MSQHTLDGQVAIVTGASSGIGEAIARVLADEGVSVVLAARSTDELRSIAAEIEQTGGTASVVSTDVTDREQVSALIEKTLAEYGRLDVLVNNAGMIDVARVEDADMEVWETMVDVNLTGLMDVTHQALPALREDDGGHVVNISSISDRRVGAKYGGYDATKFGVRGFTKALREEVSQDVRVTLLSPGLVETELPERAEELQERLSEITPLQPENVADTAVYALRQPEHVSINELVVRPSEQGR